jgi:predicted nucleotidyltransferase
MHAFITGSRIYGKPTGESDIDLVVRVDGATAEILMQLGSKNGKNPVRFGNLNLILCTSDIEYATWRVGTSTLHREKLVFKVVSDKTRAKSVFDGIRESVGLEDKCDSSDDNDR